MNFEKFLINKIPDFKGRMLEDIWQYSDEQIENEHDFIQIIFPTNYESKSSFHGYFLKSKGEITTLKENKRVIQNLKKSADWFFQFLSRNDHWIKKYDHNHLRVTRIIECLRLLVSDQEADIFFSKVLSIIKDEDSIGERTLKFWKDA